MNSYNIQNYISKSLDKKYLFSILDYELNTN